MCVSRDTFANLYIIFSQLMELTKCYQQCGHYTPSSTCQTIYPNPTGIDLEPLQQKTRFVVSYSLCSNVVAMYTWLNSPEKECAYVEFSEIFILVWCKSFCSKSVAVNDLNFCSYNEI